MRHGFFASPVNEAWTGWKLDGTNRSVMGGQAASAIVCSYHACVVGHRIGVPAVLRSMEKYPGYLAFFV